MLLEQLNTSVFVHHRPLGLHHRTSATEATAEAAASEAATATATATTTAEAARATLTTTATATATAEATSKEIQAIDDVQHCIVCNGIILRIAALHGVEDTANGRLLMQDVVELQ